MTTRRLLFAVGCASAVSCARTSDGFVRGSVVGASPKASLRVAVGKTWNPDSVAASATIAADGSFRVPADAASVVVFDDLNRDERLTPWVDRSFFCVRDDEWRCEVAPSRIVIRTLEDHDDATPPVEVLWFATPDVASPELCYQDTCNALTLHERDDHSFAQVCESMRDGVLRVGRGDGASVEIPLATTERPLAIRRIGHRKSELAAWFSEPILRARAWMVDEAHSTELDLPIALGTAGRLALARAPVACEEPDCAIHMHVARLTAQERYGDLLVDRVEELIEDVR